MMEEEEELLKRLEAELESVRRKKELARALAKICALF